MAENLDQSVYEREIDPRKYYPADLYREPQPNFPEGFTIDVGEIAEVEASPHPGEASRPSRISCSMSSTPSSRPRASRSVPSRMSYCHNTP